MDIINAVFVWAALIMSVLDLRRILVDRVLGGIHFGSAVLFTVWPLWDLCYYHSLGQWVSFCVCFLLACVRLCWFSAVYRNRKVL